MEFLLLRLPTLEFRQDQETVIPDSHVTGVETNDSGDMGVEETQKNYLSASLSRFE